MTPRRLKLLLVEDNPSDVRLIQEALAEATDDPFEVETIDTLAGALQRLGAGGVDAMLLDLGLPDSFGQETFVRAKAQGLGVAIIVLTGLKDDSLALKLVQGGAQDFVAKVDVAGNNLTRAILYAIERERAEQQVRRLNAELEQRVKDRTLELEASNKELEAFSYSVSHDLRAPLTHLIGFATILMEKYHQQLDSKAQHYLQRIDQAAHRMSALMDDLLNLAKVSRQAFPLRDVSLGGILNEVLEDFESELAGRVVDWRIADLPEIRCDRGLIKQVLANLVSNAMKYSRPRDVAVIEIGNTIINGETVFFVRDNGVGFDMTTADTLFSPFQRLHRDKEFEGTGIGLATVRRIIDRHKGRVWAESSPGRGATFFFTIGTQQTNEAQTSGVQAARA